MGFSRRGYWSGLPCPPPGDLPNPGIEPRSPTLQADSLSSEPPGKPKNTGMGSLSLLQGNFPTQELNQGFLHHRPCENLVYQKILGKLIYVSCVIVYKTDGINLCKPYVFFSCSDDM